MRMVLAMVLAQCTSGTTRILESWQFGDSDLHRKNVILNPQELKADLFLIWVDQPSRSQQLHLIWLPHDQKRQSGSELVAVPCLLLLPWQLLRTRILHHSLGTSSWIPPLLADLNCLRNANVCEESTHLLSYYSQMNTNCRTALACSLCPPPNPIGSN